jgi:outer membrane lipoprotein-sorting protein
MLLTSVLAIGAATLSLQSCGSERVEAAPPEGATSALVTLPDGSTMAAASGSLTREMADWLASRDGQSRTFDFHGFDEDRAKLTSVGLGRAADLATVLRAAPATTIEIAGDEAQIRLLTHLLEDRGIAPERMKIVPAAGIGTAMLTIHRGSRSPLMTAKS